MGRSSTMCSMQIELIRKFATLHKTIMSLFHLLLDCCSDFCVGLRSKCNQSMPLSGLTRVEHNQWRHSNTQITQTDNSAGHNPHTLPRVILMIPGMHSTNQM